MNSNALSKLQECLQLATEFVKDENTYVTGGYMTSCSMGTQETKINKKSNDIRAKAEIEASKLERQEKCAKLIVECLEYIKTINKFENTDNK